MGIIESARELGLAIQGTDEYTAYSVARDAADADAGLQELIGQFNLKKLEMGNLMGAAEQDKAKIAAVNDEIRALYSTIMGNPLMMAYNTTKTEMDKMVSFIQQIIIGSANGEAPDSITEPEGGCGGDCSGCSGCH